jgi:FKBP-type peptidyl-prolyl cis-trans isomerase
MRNTLALIMIAGLSVPAVAWAQEGKPAAAQPAAAAPAPAQAQAPAAPATPPAPKGIPVPTGEVVKKTELEGGLVVEDIKIGDGYEVKPGGAVVAHYHGTLKTDGKVFDSSFERGEPVAFPLGGVIEGWGKGVPGMKIGGIRKLTIPAKMAYGERSPSPDIPANSDLVFTIQLVDALQVIDEREGTGEAASIQSVAVTTHVIKDAAGKEIEKVEAKQPYVWLPGEFQAIQFGLDGMKVGGKRKLIVPKEMNNSPPQAQTNRPQNVPCTIELELVAVRNLGGPRK